MIDLEDDKDQTPPISDLPTNGLGFDDFHTNPLTFRDTLSAHGVSPDPSDSDTDSEATIVDDANFVFGTSSLEAGGSEVGGAAGIGTGSGVSGTNGFASYDVNGTGSEWFFRRKRLC